MNDTPAYLTDPDAVPNVTAAAEAFQELADEFTIEARDGLADQAGRDALRTYLSEMIDTLDDVEAYDAETVAHVLGDDAGEVAA